MARRRQTATTPARKPIEQYEHRDKSRANNPPIGLVTAQTDPADGRKAYAYDPHLDPQLVWAGKVERTSFEVPTVSLHVHERIDPRTIIEAVRTQDGEPAMVQGSLFETRDENPPLRQAIEFYKHAHGWSNRLIAGDSLLVMNSLLEKEGLAGQVQMIYVDPPYGIQYGSNFQPFVNRREVSDGKDEDLTQEPEMIRAFRDTWMLGIHSYLNYLRDRLLLARELLASSGSIFVQIGDENVHLVRCVLDEIFDSANFCALVTFKKTTGTTGGLLPGTADYLLWYAKDAQQVKYRPVYQPKSVGGAGSSAYSYVELADGTRRRMTPEERSDPARLPAGARVYRLDNLTSQSVGREKGEGAASWFPVPFEGREFRPTMQSRWKTNEEGMERLRAAGRLGVAGNTLSYVRYLDDFPAFPFTNVWDDTTIAGFGDPKMYVVQTNTKVVERCVLMATDPGDLVLDPTCGSGTTAYVAERWGRRWVACDTSRVAVTLAKQRLMTVLFDYYELAHPEEGVGSGFRYKTIPHITLKSIAKNEPPGQETLYDQPYVDRTKARVTGPFTVEALPAPVVMPISDVIADPALTQSSASNGYDPDGSIARSGPTLRHAEWREELLKTGIRAKSGQMILFSRVEPLPGTRWLHADAETRPSDDGSAAALGAERAVISFGPEAAPLEQTQVERALEEAWRLVPRPRLLVFAAFQFDPEAAKDIDETNIPGITLLKAQMNADLLTADLKKKRASNESFWLVGQPDIEVSQAPGGRYQVEVHGFDYYNTRTGQVESGDRTHVAMWLLDPDYDGRSLFPRQVFFLMAGDNDGWARLAKNLKAEIDEDRIEAYRGTVSLPFALDEHRRVAVKIVDDRGIESLKIVPLD